MTSGSVNRVYYTKQDEPSTIQLNQEFDVTSPPYLETFNITAEPNTVGATPTVLVQARNGSEDVCSKTIYLEIIDSAKWWQVEDADVFAKGVLNSILPGGVDYFDLKGSHNPGVPVHASGIPDFGSNGGAVSETGWLVLSDINLSDQYDYTYYNKAISKDAEEKVVEINGASKSGNTLENIIDGAVADSRGYKWLKATHLTGFAINGQALDIGANDRVIMFVDADSGIDIRENINVADGGYFMLISDGNININPDVTNLEGIYVADEDFITGSNGENLDDQLNVRGSVVAWSNVNLQRDLVNDHLYPAEKFTFAPDFMALYPPPFRVPRIRMNEVAP